MKPYDPKKSEKKWQAAWQKSGIYEASDTSKKPKFYGLIEFPYPSGDGLHVGHIRSNTAMDIVARKRRMEGYNVLYPIGWDAFGLPTENYALKTGIAPQLVTEKNTDTFRRQLKALGFSFDWTREVNTTDPAYYRWTQWIFLQLWKKNLAYKKKTLINWCPKDKIGLANEEVVNGCCERCGTPVEKREKEQWMLAITKYADRLDKDLDTVDYLPEIKTQQRNWIGRSEGSELEFAVRNAPNSFREKIKIFTTRADTLFGVTYVVVAPEHPLIPKLLLEISNKSEVEAYIASAKKKSEMDRTDAKKEKTGVELKGIRAINPANAEDVPIFVADYVLAEYGTGAVMAVPAHDERDGEFAKKYNLPLREVLESFYVQTTEPGVYRKDEPIVPRNGIITIIKHWSEDKYIGLKWKKVAWKTFLTGGIEPGQTAEHAGLTEIREETGFLHPKFIKEIGITHGLFYHVPKKENRLVHGHIVYFELQNDAREPVSESEASIHDIQWLTLDELKTWLTPATHTHALALFRNKLPTYTGEGILVNSGKFNGMDSEKAKKAITESVGGKMVTTFKLRDWVFSRQRYWGEPIPLVFCKECGWQAVAEKDLPVKLPPVAKYEPTDTGESPLAGDDPAMKKWRTVKCPKCGGEATRETDTMPNWAGSSWYFLRYIDPKNSKALAAPAKLKYWQPVDWYNGGMEHTTLHLLYSRFWNKFLFDIGAVPTSEAYAKRTAHGLILAPDGEKMSKSRGNVINPDSIVNEFGADTLRLYEMFMGPFAQAVSWSTDGIVGPRRFLEKVWRLSEKVVKKSKNRELDTLTQKTIKKVATDIEAMQFNTAISAMMILSNEMEKQAEIPAAIFEPFLQILAPFAPHIAEELWSQLGHKKSIHIVPWPQADESKIKEQPVTIIIQVNGKVRGEFQSAPGLTEDSAKTQALATESVKKWLEGKEPKKVIYVPGRLVNIVV